jgi:hypothetical protein
MTDEQRLRTDYSKKTVREAILFVAQNPDRPSTPPLDMPIWELIARNLFEHATKPDARVQGSMNRSVRAQQIILNRTTGTRRTGTHPAQAADQRIKFADMTKGVINE